MPKALSQRTRALNKKTGFRAGRSAACEARLFQFTGQSHGEGESPIKQVAACNLHQAITHLRKWHPERKEVSAGLKTLHPDWPNTNATGFVKSVYADPE